MKKIKSYNSIKLSQNFIVRNKIDLKSLEIKLNTTEQESNGNIEKLHSRYAISSLGWYNIVALADRNTQISKYLNFRC